MSTYANFRGGDRVRMYLCRPSDRQTIAELRHVANRSIVKNYGGVNELSFTVPFQILDDDMQPIVNPLIDQIYGDYIVRYEEGEENDYYLITDPEYIADDNGKMTLGVKCYQQQYEWKNKIVRAFKGTHLLYDPVGSDGVLNQTLLQLTDWSMDYIDASLLNKYRTFDTSESDLLAFVLSAIETYGAYIPVVNTAAKKLSIYLDENYGWNEGLRIANGHYLKSLNKTERFDEVITRLYVYGNEELSINEINPTGASFLEDFSFYRHGFEEDDQGNVISSSKFMSDGLCRALNAYDALLLTKSSVFAGYVTQVEQLQVDRAAAENVQFVRENELQALMVEKDALIGTGGNLTAINAAIVAKETQLADSEHDIDDIDGQIEQVETAIAALQAELSEQNHFTPAQIKEKNRFTKWKVWTDTNYTKIEDLYEQGRSNLALWSQPNVSYQCDIVDIIKALNVTYDKDKVKLGAIVSIHYPKFGIDIQAKIIVINHDIDDNKLSVTIANTKDIKSGFLKIKDLLQKSASTSTSVDMSKYKWDLSTENNTQLNRILNSKWDANKQAIEGGSGLQYLLNERGLTISSPGDPLRFLRAVNSTISITNDGGNTYKNALTSQGLVAEQIYGTLIAGSNLTIENSAGTVNINSTGMTISKMDLTMISDNEDKRLYLNPNVGILLQAKVGGTFVDRLAMDSSGNMTMTGSLTTGTGASAVRADTNGLYIGSPSFATAPFSVTPTGKVTANDIAIKGGTMSIGSRFGVAADGTLTVNNANISGNINMTGGNINWASLNSDPVATGAASTANSAFAISNAIAKGEYFGGTFIDGKQIYSPLITGATITGSILRTGVSPSARIEINSSGLTTYDSTNKKRIVIDSSRYYSNIQFNDQTGDEVGYIWADSLGSGSSKEYTLNIGTKLHNNPNYRINLGLHSTINNEPIATQKWVNDHVVAKWE